MQLPLEDRPSIEEAAIDDGAANAPHAAVVALNVSGLSAIDPTAALATRVFCDARALARARHAFGIDDWHVQPCQHEAPVAPGETLPGPTLGVPPASVRDPGVIELAHLAGSASIGIDLAEYPALRAITPLAGNAAEAAQALATAALRTALAAALLAPLLEQLTSLGLGAWRVAAVRRGNVAADQALYNLSVGAGGRSHRLRIACPPALLALAERLVGQPEHAAPMPDRTTSPLDVRVPSRVTLGRKWLSVDTLGSLSPGDVVLRAMPSGVADAIRHAQPFQAACAWGSAGMRRLHTLVQCEGSTLTVMKEVIMAEEMPYEDDYASVVDNMHDEPIQVGELDLPVQFEIETLAFPLAQLSALRPGYVIELATPVTEAHIRLVAHGQTIGQGELVTVGDHLGIRITRMAHDHGTDQ